MQIYCISFSAGREIAKRLGLLSFQIRRKRAGLPHRGCQRQLTGGGNDKAKPYLAGGGLSRLTELAMEVVKVWRKPAASLLRMATLRTFGLLSERLP